MINWKNICKICKKQNVEVEIKEPKFIDSLKKWDGKDLFGEERWNLIKKGMLKIYGEKYEPSSYLFYIQLENDIPLVERLIEIPLDHIPGVGEISFFWEYTEDSLTARIVSYASGESHCVYKSVQLEEPINLMIEKSELDEKKRMEEEQRKKDCLERKEDRLNGKNDASVKDLYKYIYEREIKNIGQETEEEKDRMENIFKKEWLHYIEHDVAEALKSIKDNGYKVSCIRGTKPNGDFVDVNLKNEDLLKGKENNMEEKSNNNSKYEGKTLEELLELAHTKMNDFINLVHEDMKMENKYKNIKKIGSCIIEDKEGMYDIQLSLRYDIQSSEDAEIIRSGVIRDKEGIISFLKEWGLYE